MPHHPARPCAHRGCVSLVHGQGIRYCADHLAEVRQRQDARRGTSAQRGYDAEWRKVRDKFLADHPWCMDCGAQSEVAHHEHRKRAGGSDNPGNLIALCRPCHSRRHAKTQESFRGRVIR